MLFFCKQAVNNLLHFKPAYLFVLIGDPKDVSFNDPGFILSTSKLHFQVAQFNPEIG